MANAKSAASLATCATLIAGSFALQAYASARKTQVPRAISSFIAPKAEVRVTLSRLEPGGIDHEIQLTEADALRVRDVLNSPATYGDTHLGCVTGGYQVRIEQFGRHIDLLVDLPCYHVLDAETWHDIGLLSESGHRFFDALLAKYAHSGDSMPSSATPGPTFRE